MENGLVITFYYYLFICKCPVYFAPAMDLICTSSTIASFKALQKFGNTIIPAESGELASGLSGEGRMAEPENIVSFWKLT
jgi:phosphopantothenoylcysteine decarboxylase/phosphopantothenate--cysteine ligase